MHIDSGYEIRESKSRDEGFFRYSADVLIDGVWTPAISCALPDSYDSELREFLEKLVEERGFGPHHAEEPDESMDGDHESALASAGLGTLCAEG